MSTQRITISLDKVEDADILHWLAQCENRSQYIRNAIRRDRDRARSSEMDASTIRQIIREELANITITGENGPKQEDPELAARLDNMF